MGTLREQTFHNFKLSLRGSMRRPPSVMSWVVVLHIMQGAGDNDIGAIIRHWNKDSPKSAQLTGVKAQSVKHLLENATGPTLDLLAQHVSTYGWEHCCCQ